MELRLYSSFSKKKNSTLIPTGEYSTKSVILKSNTSLVNPVFLIDGINLSANYCYLVDAGRYYFIDDIILSNNNIYELHCSTDYLATFKTAIGNLSTFVSRCADSGKYNTLLPDHAVSNENGISSINSSSTYVGLSNSLSYIVRVVGKDATGGVGTFYFPNVSALQNAFGVIWGDLEGIDPDQALKTLVQLYAFNPAQYITNVYTTPIGATTYASYSSTEQVCFGGHETNIHATRVNTAMATLVNNAAVSVPAGIYSDFRKYDPAFSQYSIYIPTIGTVPLSSDVVRKSLTITLGADLTAGDLFFILKADGDIIATYNSNVYNSFNFASLSVGQVVGDVASIAVDMATSNVVGFAGDVIKGIRNVVSPTPSLISAQGGTGCVGQANEVVVTLQQKTSADLPVAIYGRPCCKNLTLNTLSGYIQCENASINLAGLTGDKEQVNALLNSGFYFE